MRSSLQEPIVESKQYWLITVYILKSLKVAQLLDLQRSTFRSINRIDWRYTSRLDYMAC